MSGAVERIPVLVSRREKAVISRNARAAGLSMGEYLRRGAKAYRASSDEDEKLLLGLIDQMNKTTDEANRAIDDLIKYVAASNRRIGTIERRLSKGRPR